MSACQVVLEFLYGPLDGQGFSIHSSVASLSVPVKGQVGVPKCQRAGECLLKGLECLLGCLGPSNLVWLSLLHQVREERC